MEEGSLIKSIDVKFFSPCENVERVGHPVTLNGKLGFGSGGGNYTTSTHINFYHFHFLTLTFSPFQLFYFLFFLIQWLKLKVYFLNFQSQPCITIKLGTIP